MASVLLIALQPACGADWRYEDDELEISAFNRSPDQVASFYEGRGFPKPMIDATRNQCFIVWSIRNKTAHVLLMDLARWSFVAESGLVTRVTRAQWFKLWERMGAPANSRATFRWTLLPETLDLQPNESVGGNITLAAFNAPFEVTMSFAAGGLHAATAKRVQIKGVQCAHDTH
ncbi:MAG: hypothetical protein AABY83_08170 [Pseudomonadota bacterium]